MLAQHSKKENILGDTLRDNNVESLDRLPELDEKHSLPVVSTAKMGNLQNPKSGATT